MFSKSNLLLALMFIGATIAQEYTFCGLKNIMPMEDFDYDEFAGYTYSYKYYPTDPSYFDVISSYQNFKKVDENYYISRAVINRLNGSQDFYTLKEFYLGDGRLYEIQLDEYGYDTTLTFSLVFYGGKKGCFYLYYGCRNNGSVPAEYYSTVENDFRYTIARVGYNLTEEDQAYIRYMEAVLPFSGGLMEVPTRKGVEVIDPGYGEIVHPGYGEIIDPGCGRRVYLGYDQRVYPEGNTDDAGYDQVGDPQYGGINSPEFDVFNPGERPYDDEIKNPRYGVYDPGHGEIDDADNDEIENPRYAGVYDIFKPWYDEIDDPGNDEIEKPRYGEMYDPYDTFIPRYAEIDNPE
uniref:Uncharacterized protein n=1 Tax=Clastoptera arizonana TaxID=38151 RepID=A0A1B6DJW4_9HEMI